MKHSVFPVLALMFSVAALVSGAEDVKAAKDAPKEEEAKVADISHGDLMKAIKEKKVVLLDCNGTEVYALGHIPGALDFVAVKDDLAKKLPADKAALIVAYCGGPL
jgi:3-mercaptopyruvate sulfurtransferase SseA